MRKIFFQVLFYAFILTLWQGVVSLKVWPEYLVPSPLKVFQTLRDGFIDKSFLIGIGISLKRIAIGYSLAMVGGIVLGLLLAQIQFMEESLGSFILGLHSLPSICWLPVGVLWFGLSDRAILLVVLLGSFFSIAIATKDGIKNISPIYVRAAKTMGSKGYHLYWGVILPAALPSIVSGLKQGWSLAWRSLMAGEILFVSLGLGHLLQMGRELNDISQIFAVMIVIVLIGLMIDFWFFEKIEKKIRVRWGLIHNE